MKFKQVILPTALTAAVALGASNCNGTPKRIETPPIPQCSNQLFLPGNQNVIIAPEAIGETANVSLFEDPSAIEPLQSMQVTLGERFDCSQPFPEEFQPTDPLAPAVTAFKRTSDDIQCAITSYEISCYKNTQDDGNVSIGIEP